MFFSKKPKKNEIKCENCSSKISKDFSFCPHCGNSLSDREGETEDFGMLGKNDIIEKNSPNFSSGFGITDKFINSMVNNIMKSFGQFKDAEKTEIKTFPNGIRIKVGMPAAESENPKPMPKLKELNEEQIAKISSLPKSQAKTSVRRINNKVIYELNTPGVESVKDVFASRTESGYEIKAIGKRKIYLNRVPVSLNLEKLSVINNKLFLEFREEEQ